MRRRGILIFFLIILVLGFMIPQTTVVPVEGADTGSFHPNSFWYYPWGKSVTHKGIDIFAKKGTPVLTATTGIILHKGTNRYGGNVVYVLGPKWRIHYYAHLDTIETSRFKMVSRGEKIGRVGDSGNAKGKPAHLHYTIATLFPYPWRADSSIQGWKKMFYLDPSKEVAF